MIDRLSRAGTETQLLALIHHLDRRRVQPSLVLLDGNDSESTELAPKDCPVLRLGLRKLLSWRSPLGINRLLKFWKHQRVDLVQSYLVDSTYFALPLAKFTGRPLLRVRNNLGYFLSPLHRRLGRMVGRMARYSLTNSDDGARALVASDGVPIARVKVLTNGVDLERFASVTPLAPSTSVLRIGAVANLRPVKNLDGLIRAFARVAKSWPQVRLDIAGEGEQRGELEQLAEKLGIADRICLRGAERDVPSFLNTVHVAVLCSHSESMSNALLEYMAAGRAIVATDVGASATICRDGREGLIVPVGNDEHLAAALERLISNPVLACRLGRAAQEQVTRDHSRAAMIQRFTELYERLVER